MKYEITVCCETPAAAKTLAEVFLRNKIPLTVDDSRLLICFNEEDPTGEIEAAIAETAEHLALSVRISRRQVG